MTNRDQAEDSIWHAAFLKLPSNTVYWCTDCCIPQEHTVFPLIHSPVSVDGYIMSCSLYRQTLTAAAVLFLMGVTRGLTFRPREAHSYRRMFMVRVCVYCAEIYVRKSNSLRSYWLLLSHVMQFSSCQIQSSVMRSLLLDCFGSKGPVCNILGDFLAEYGRYGNKNIYKCVFISV